jgi:hypothetical protein
MTALVILLGGPALLATLLVAWDVISRRQEKLERREAEGKR